MPHLGSKRDSKKAEESPSKVQPPTKTHSASQESPSEGAKNLLSLATTASKHVPTSEDGHKRQHDAPCGPQSHVTPSPYGMYTSYGYDQPPPPPPPPAPWLHSAIPTPHRPSSRRLFSSPMRYTPRSTSEEEDTEKKPEDNDQSYPTYTFRSTPPHRPPPYYGAPPHPYVRPYAPYYYSGYDDQQQQQPPTMHHRYPPASPSKRPTPSNSNSNSNSTDDQEKKKRKLDESQTDVEIKIANNSDDVQSSPTVEGEDTEKQRVISPASSVDGNKSIDDETTVGNKSIEKDAVAPPHSHDTSHPIYSPMYAPLPSRPPYQPPYYSPYGGPYSHHAGPRVHPSNRTDTSPPLPPHGGPAYRMPHLQYAPPVHPHPPPYHPYGYSYPPARYSPQETAPSTGSGAAADDTASPPRNNTEKDDSRKRQSPQLQPSPEKGKPAKKITSVAEWQRAAIATGMAPSANRCMPLPQPVPSKYWGEAEKTKDTPIPDFHRLVNYPDYLNKIRPNGAEPPGSVGTPVGKRHCVMCGKLRICSASSASLGASSLRRSKCKLDEDNNEDETESKHIIPRQNKGLCTACDVTVWVVTDICLEIKWCKGCKNFRPWAAFGDKGLATKCVRCRDRQREKYAMQKDVLRLKRLKQSSRQTEEEKKEETQHEIDAAKGLRDLMAAKGLRDLMAAQV